MKIMSSIACVFAVSVMTAASQGTAQAQTKARQVSPATQRVQAFLKFHLAHDSGLTSKNLEARKAWLAPALYKSLQYELKRQAAFQAKNPDEVPFINGDVFTSSQETPTSYRLLEKRGQDVLVQYKFGPSERLVLYRVRLLPGKPKQQWLIEDVISDGESLMKTLQRPNYMENTAPAAKQKTPG
jgi:hypothetical protein